MRNIVELKWKRPESLDYPKVWYTFRAKDVDSDEIVNYRIEDSSESKSEEALSVLVQYFCKEEPLCEAYDLFNDPEAIEDLAWYWKSIIKQKTSLVCYKDGSNEIAGLNMNFVLNKDDHFMEDIQRQNESDNNKKMFDILFLIYENYDTYKHYNVDKYLTSGGLVVATKYRGRNIGDHFLKARSAFCKATDITLTATMFTSDFSNRNADKAGFKLDKILSYDEVRKRRPDLKLPPVKSSVMTIKSIVY